MFVHTTMILCSIPLAKKSEIIFVESEFFFFFKPQKLLNLIQSEANCEVRAQRGVARRSEVYHSWASGGQKTKFQPEIDWSHSELYISVEDSALLNRKHILKTQFGENWRKFVKNVLWKKLLLFFRGWKKLASFLHSVKKTTTFFHSMKKLLLFS